MTMRNVTNDTLHVEYKFTVFPDLLLYQTYMYFNKLSSLVQWVPNYLLLFAVLVNFVLDGQHEKG